MKIMIAASGTAGHINPAIAIAEEIKKNEPDSEIIFVGTARGMENDLVPRYGYKVEHIESYGLQRKLTAKNIKVLKTLVSGPKEAKHLIQLYKPSIILGMGGYFSWPLIKAGASLGVPCAVHESNAVYGRSTRMMLKYVKRVYQGFDVPEPSGEKVLVTGTPVLRNSAPVPESERILLESVRNETKKTVLSFGGSLGSDIINGFIVPLAQNNADIRFIHVTGKKRYVNFANGRDLPSNLTVTDFIYNMESFEEISDLVISRSGSSTVNELLGLGKHAILIPYAKAVNNHQLYNARILGEKGLAEIIEEKNLTLDSIERALKFSLSKEPSGHVNSASGEHTISCVPENIIYKDLCKLAAT